MRFADISTDFTRRCKSSTSFYEMQHLDILTWVKAKCQAPQPKHTVKVVCFCKRKTLALTDDFFEPFSFSHCCISTHIIHLKPSSKLDTHHHFYQNARQDVISTHTALTRCLPAATLCASPRCPSTAFSSPRSRSC